jgi:uncharacterized protein YpmB
MNGRGTSMTPNRVGAALLLVAACGALAGVSSFGAFVGTTQAAAPTGDPHKAAVVTVDQAEKALRAATGHFDGTLEYRGVRDRPGISAYEFSGGGVDGYVDVADGHVTLLTVHKEVSGAPVTINADDAERAADKYLKSIASPTDGMEVSVTDSTASAVPGFTVSYQRRQNGVDLPDYRVVGIDGTDGAVVMLVDVRRPYAPIRVEKVAKAEAIQRAVSKTKGDVKGVREIVTFDRAGTQQQVWEVTISQSSGSLSAVYIDSQDGSLFDPFS